MQEYIDIREKHTNAGKTSTTSMQCERNNIQGTVPTCGQSSIINHQSSIINHQSSIINHQSLEYEYETSMKIIKYVYIDNNL
jgi:hypothetical protein